MLSTIDRTRRVPIDRSGDRLVALAGIGIALAFLGVALGSLALPPEIRRGLWLPLHLALAGGASSAIAGVLPFFVAAFAAAPPAGVTIRAAGLGAVTLGAGAVSIGVVAGSGAVAAASGVVYIAGIVLVGLASTRPLAGALGPGRGLVTRAYLVALTLVSVGAVLATLYLAGWPPVLEAWGRLRPAHAWLNLIGFVSLVIAATLVHFFPTVVGARIGGHRSGRVAVVALATGPAVVAIGYTFELALIVVLGALVAGAGAFALVAYTARVWATRARWTTDPGWHRFAMGGLWSAIGWFAVGMTLLAGSTIAAGASPAGWSLDRVAGPLVIGWVVLAILASATHLVPAVGPGDQSAHARQRAILGGAAGVRLIVLDVGVVGLSTGVLLDRPEAVAAGTLLISAGLAISIALFVRAIAVGLEPRRS